jgi:16S rRNA processing protein RimM
MSKRPTYIQHSPATSSGSPTPGEPEFLAVGKLRRPHGVRGEMLMILWTDFPERLRPGKQVFVGKSHEPLCIRKVRGHGEDSIISFNEFKNREDAGRYRNQIVYVRTSDIPHLPNDEIYLHQLLGLHVISDEDDRHLGIVAEILETGANHVLLIRRDGKSDILIPDIDDVVLDINLEKSEIRVHLLPGLIQDDQD